jgi:hypothetical protein
MSPHTEHTIRQCQRSGLPSDPVPLSRPSMQPGPDAEAAFINGLNKKPLEPTVSKNAVYREITDLTIS